MPGRNNQRLDVVLAAQDRADHPATMDQISAVAAPLTKLAMATDQDRFRHPDRRQTGNYPKVRSDAESTRMRYALPIDEN